MEQAQALAALGALAQDTRLQLYRLLVTVGPDGLSAGNIAERLGVIPSSLSFHLTNLVHAGLITQRRVGRLMVYAAAYHTMNALLAYLSENCCGQGASCADLQPGVADPTGDQNQRSLGSDAVDDGSRTR